MKTRLFANRISRKAVPPALGLLGLLALASAPAFAEIKDLVARAPSDTNAIVAVDVAALLNTPIAKAQAWGTREDAPLFLQRGTDRLLIASRINLARMDSDWDVALLEMSKAPSLASITLAESGLSDKVGTFDAVWSPRHAYFLVFEPQLLGVSTPDDRQFAARWARQQASRSTPVVSPYLQTAAALTNSTNPLVLALDLQDAINLKKAQRALVTDLSRATLLKDTPSGKVAELLTTLKGVTVSMQFATDISGRITLDFGADPAILTTVGGPLLNDVLTQNGLGLQEFESWKASAAPHQLVYTGKLSVPAFMKLSSFLQPTSSVSPPPPAAAAPAAPANAGAAPAAADPRQATIEASRKYYRAVCSTIDSLGQPASLGDGAAWLKRAAQRIEKLPMANVDPELVAWGTTICGDLLGMAQQLATGQTQLTAKAAGSYFNNAQGYTGYNTDTWDGGMQVRVDNEKLVSAQREATQAERARLTEPVAKRLSEIMASKMPMRAALSTRYGVEF